MQICECENENTGFAKCQEALREGVGLIITYTRGSDQQLNNIPFGTVIDEVYVNSKLQAPDKLDRWYPVASANYIKNMELNAIAAQTESYNDGSTAKTTDSGLILENMLIQNATPHYLGVLDSFCGDISVYVIDAKGTILGQTFSSDRENFYPKQVSKPSYNLDWRGATGGQVAGVTMSFEFSKTDRIKDIRWISGDTIQYNLGDATGMFDVNLSAVATNSTTLTITATDTFGYPAGPVLGMTDTTDWLLTDKDGLTLATLTASDLASTGVYTVTHPDATGLYPITIKSGATVYAKNYELRPATVTV